MKLTVICKDNNVTLMDVEIVSVQVMPDMKSISVDDGILICGPGVFEKLSREPKIDMRSDFKKVLDEYENMAWMTKGEFSDQDDEDLIKEMKEKYFNE